MSCNLCTLLVKLAEYVSSKGQLFLYYLCVDVSLFCFVGVSYLQSSMVGL